MKIHTSRYVFFIVVLTVAWPAIAQESPNRAHGFNADKVYQFGNIDSINIFNGGLIIPIPLGQQYKVSDGLSYGLSLVYNGNVWDYTQRCITELINGGWETTCKNQAYPSRLSNAGLGFLVTLGELLPPGSEWNQANTDAHWLYVSPDGARHAIGADYTRMRDVGTNVKEIDFPDGITRRFEQSGIIWRLTEIRDRYSSVVPGSLASTNFVHLTYTTWSEGAESGNEIDVVDSAGRTQRIKLIPGYPDPNLPTAMGEFFSDDGATRNGFVYPPTVRDNVRYVDVSGPGGSTERYIFDYDFKEGLRGPNHNDLESVIPSRAKYRVLRSLTLPDASKYSFQKSDGTLGYGDQGELLTFRLPTGGRITYTYGQRVFPIFPPQFRAGMARFEIPPDVSVKIVTRELLDSTPGALPARWTYTDDFAGDYLCAPDGILAQCPPLEMKITVTDPLGNRTENFFSIAQSSSYQRMANPGMGTWPYQDGWRDGQYGLPFTRLQKTADGTRFLSTRVYDAAGALLRSTYVKYDGDDPNFDNRRKDLEWNHPRVLASRTVFEDDRSCGGEACYVDEENDFASYDGFGHYRRQTITSNFGPRRETFTTFNSSPTPTDRLGKRNGIFAIAPDQPWIIDLYDQQTVTEGTQTAYKRFCFDPDKGRLTRTRIMLGALPVPTDLVSALDYDNNGNLKRESYYGGDGAVPAPADLCAFDTTITTPQYAIRHEVPFGIRTKSYYVVPGSNDTKLLSAYDVDLDSSTGLPTFSRDAAGLTTEFRYSIMGRLKEVHPPNAAWTEYGYKNAGDPGYPFATVIIQDHGVNPGNVDILTDNQVEFDGFGRVYNETTTMPGGVKSIRRTTYNENGWKATVSERGTDPTAHLTTFSNYDPFGRAHTITAPDNTQTRFDYIGAKTVTHTVNIAMPAGPTDVTTTETHDAFGRLIAVEEPSGTATNLADPRTANVKTEYAYEVGNHLTKVEAMDFTDASRPHQLRTFTYDLRGFLNDEFHPEKGTTRYSGYDARGHLLRKQDGTSSTFDLTYAYDASERLTRIQSTVGGGAIKEFYFDSVSDGVHTLSGPGRLLKSVRHNRTAALGDIQVTDYYAYDNAGRVSSKETRLSTGPVFTQNVTYTDLSQPDFVRYPTCAGCGAATGPNRNIRLEYSYGLLTGVQGFTSDLTNGIGYWPNGMVRTVVHSGSDSSHTTVDTQGFDPSGMPRPASIDFSGYCVGPTLSAPTPSSVTVVSGGSADFTIAAPASVAMPRYQWYKGARGVDTSPIAGATSPALHVTGLTESSAFWVRVTGDNGCSSDSQTVTVNIRICDAATLKITAQPASTVVAPGGSALLTVAASDANARYEWYEGISGSTANKVGTAREFNTGPLIKSTSYWVRVYSSDGLCSVDSATARVDICGPPQIIVPPQSLTKPLPALGQTVRLTASVTAIGSGVLRYEWYNADNNTLVTTEPTLNVDFTNDPMANPNWSAPRRYFVKIFDTTPVTACNGPTVSEIITMRVSDAPCMKFSNIPWDYFQLTPARPGFTLSLAVEGPATLNYKWFHGINGQKSELVNYTSPSLGVSVNTFTNGDYDAFWCEVTSPDCPNMTLTTPKSYGFRWGACPLPPVTVIPARFTAPVSSGISPTFTAFVDWQRVTYQWYAGESGDTSRPYRGATQATFSPGTVVGGTFWVRVTANDTDGCYRDSQTVAFTVGACDAVYIRTQPQSVEIPAGGTATLHTEASSSLPFTYEWYEKGLPDTFAGSGPTLNVPATTVSKRYVARMTPMLPNGDRCTSFDTREAIVRVMSCPGITINQQAQKILVFPGRLDPTLTVDLSVNATSTSGPISYQWYIGPAGDTTQPISGATASTVRVTESEPTSYWVRLTTSSCTVDSDTACVPPYWTRPMVGGSMRQGEWALLESTAAGDGLTYEWYLNAVAGTPISREKAFWVQPTDTTTYVLKVIGKCATKVSDPIMLSVCAPPIVSEQPQNAVVFPGKSATLHTTVYEANHVPITYQWIDELGAGVGTNSPTLVTPPITAQKTFSVQVLAGICSTTSQPATVSLCALPEVFFTGTTQNIAPGQTVILRGPGNPYEGDTIAWYRGPEGDLASSVHVGNDTFEYAFFAPVSGTTTYWARVTHPTDGCVSRTNAYTVNVCLPRITAQPLGSMLLNQSQPVTLSVTADLATSYQWYQGTRGDLTASTPIPNATGASVAVAPTADKHYWVRVQGTCGYVDSDEVVVTVCQPPTIVQAPPGASLVLGSSFMLGVNASGTNLTYQWYTGAKGDTSAPIVSGTSLNQTVAPSNTTNYWVRISGTCGSVDSNTMVVQVCARPAITTQPQSVMIFSGTTTTLSVTAFEGTTSPLSYQWYRGLTGDDSAPVIGATASTFTTPALTADTSYWVRVGCLYCPPTDSDTATVSMCTFAQTISAPSDVQIAIGQITRLIAFGSTGGAYSYRWYRGASGDTSAPLGDWQIQNYIDVAPTVTTQYWYQLQSGTCLSNSLTVTVSVCIPTITTQPTSTMINPGASTTLSVVANTVGLTYQWYIGASGTMNSPIAGATSSTLTVSPTTDTSYWVRVTGSCGRSVDSNTVTITICQVPAIVQYAPGWWIALGTSYQLGVNASGTNLTYQWYVGATGNTATPIAGATGPSQTVSPSTTTNYWVRVSGTCGSKDSATITVSVCGTPTINTQPQSVSIFSGASATLSVSATSATTAPLTYQWYRGASGDTSAPVGTNSPTFTTPSLTTDTSYWVMVSSGTCTGVASATATVSMCAFGQTLSPPPDVQIAVGQSTRLTGWGASGAYLYMWFRGASGDTSNPLTGWQASNYLDVSPTVTTQYWYRLQDGSCVSSSLAVTVNVCIPTITTQPGSAMINSGTPTTLSVVANTGGLTYQWYIGTSGTTTSPIAGATSSTLTVSPTTDTNYWVRVTGSCSRSVDSNTATITICQPPAISPSSGGPWWISRGSSWTLGVGATGTNLTYQWYTGTSGNAASPIAGATNPALVVSPQNTTTYWVRVTGTCGSRDSITMTVAVCLPPSITAQPQSVSIFSGASATLSVTATEATTSPVTYQWYRGVSGDTSVPVGTNASTFTTPALTAETSYWVRVSCGTCTPADSQTATISMCTFGQTLSPPPDVQIAVGQSTRLTAWGASGAYLYMWFRGASGDTSAPLTSWQSVNYLDVSPTVTTQYWYRLQDGSCVSSSLAVTVNVCIPTITTQPASVMINSGTSTTLSVVANTSGLTYQWYVGTSGTMTSPIAGATGASLTVTPSATTNYWVRVTSSCGRTVDGNTATVTICQPPAITGVTASLWIARGSSWTLSVAATGTNLTYQWYTGTSGNTASPIAGATGTTTTVSPQNTTSYWVRVSGSCGAANSATVTVSVCAPPTITAQPQSISIFSGTSTTLSVTATEATTSPVGYQWYRGATGDFSTPVGTNSPTYTTPALTTQTSYWVRVSCGTCTPADSDTATVSICLYPQTVAAPADVQIAVGQYAHLTGVGVSAGNSYQWFRGASGDPSNPLTPGYQSVNYIDVAPTVTTQYWYRLQNGSCISNSGTATVFVCVPTITTQPQSVTIASGTSTTLAVAANTVGVTYQWYIGASGTTTSPIAGATGTSFTVSPTATTSYWARATSTCGRTADSATATVTVCEGPVITRQPRDGFVNFGGQQAYTDVIATGTNLTYQWYQGETGDLSYPLSGQTGSSLTWVIYSTIHVWVRISGMCGAVNSQATWLSAPPVITSQPASVIASYGSAAMFEVGAGGTYLHYAWYWGNSTPIAGAPDGPRLILNPVTANASVFCVVTSGIISRYSDWANVTLCDGPYITSTQVGVVGSCRYITVNTNNPYGNNLYWYQGVRGDTSQPLTQFTGNSTLSVCPTTPTTYWCRVVDETVPPPTCYTDTQAWTLP